ncbi:MAG: AAA family ATPase [Anaerolineales bacterium]
MEPLPETWAAYEAARSPAVKPAPQVKTQPTWTVLPSLELTLVGRKKAWEALEDSYRRFQQGGLIFIRGEPGIGKSRLLQEFATSQDRLVLSGNSHASTQRLPYEPLTQALRQALSLPQLWVDIRPIWLSEAGRLLPELSDHFPDLPKVIEVEPDQAQARLYEALTQCALGIAATAPTLLCLDDLQWADESTLCWLTYLSGWLAGSGLCILAAHRLEGAAALASLRQSFSRINLLAEISLSGLSKEAIASVLEQLPQPPPRPGDLAARIQVATGGNPFFILETLRAMLENNQIASPPEALPLPESVQEAILGRLEKLSPLARQVLEAAAVLAPELDQRLLQETAGRADFEVADGLDELVRRQMLTDGDPPRLSHDLLTQVTYQNLSPWRRRLLHQRAAQTLEEFYRGQVDEAAAQIALHYDASGRVEAALRYFHKAAIVAQGRYAQGEAISYLERAIELSAALTLEPYLLSQLHALLGDSLVAKGRFETARQAYRESLAFIPAGEILRRGEVQRKLGMTFLAQRRQGEAEQVFDAALESLGPGPEGRETAWQASWLDIQLARLEMLYFQHRLEQLDELLRRIEPILDEIGTSKHYDIFYGGQWRLLAQQQRFSLTKKTTRIAEKMLSSAQETDEPAALAYAKFGLGFSLLWAGDLKAAVGLIKDSLHMAEEIGVAMTQCLSLSYLTYCLRLQGDVEGVRINAGRALEIARQLGIPAYIAAAHSNRAWLAWRENKLEEAERRAEKALTIWGQYPHPFKWSAYWILCDVQLGQMELKKAIESARGMLHPAQQRLPEDVTEALESAVNNWEARNEAAARQALCAAVELAQKRGYL